MKKTTFTLCFLFIYLIHYAQLPQHSIQAIAGYSKHGSGDMDGIVFGAEYIRYKTDRFSLNYNFRSTINHSKHEILIMDQSGNLLTDASIRFTTAALQLGVNAGLSIVRNRSNEFLISLGGFGRYQSASNGSDGYSLYGPAVTGQPTYLVGYDNETDQNTIAAGGIFQLSYNYTFNKTYLGLFGAFQTDTNGDAIPQLGLMVGRRL